MHSASTVSQPRTYSSVAVAVAAALSLQPTPSVALGLGQLSARSSLGEPLETEVELHLNSADQHGRIEFDVTASPDAGPGAVLPQLIESSGPAGPVLRLKTTQPVNEPIVTFTLVARSATGTVTRDYTVLLDPPREPATKPGSSVVPAKASSVSQVRDFMDDGSVRVADGHTLWEIGTRLAAGSQLAGSQFAWALFEANRGAFSGGRPEGLRAGERLRIPTLASASAIPATVARSWLRGGIAPGAGENLASAELASGVATTESAARRGSNAMLLAGDATQDEASSSRQSRAPGAKVVRSTGRLTPARRVAGVRNRGEGERSAAAPYKPMATVSTEASPARFARVSLRLQRSLLEEVQAAEPQSVRLARLEAAVDKLQTQLAARDQQIAQLMQLAETHPAGPARVDSALGEALAGDPESDQRSSEAPALGEPLLAGLFGAGSMTVLVSAATPLLVSRFVSNWSRQVLRSLMRNADER